MKFQAKIKKTSTKEKEGIVTTGIVLEVDNKVGEETSAFLSNLSKYYGTGIFVTIEP